MWKYVCGSIYGEVLIGFESYIKIHLSKSRFTNYYSFLGTSGAGWAGSTMGLSSNSLGNSIPL